MTGEARRTIAYITAGAGGMYCGSCMHDNTLARAMTRLGVEILLIPTYTPIRTDEQDVSIDRVFFGGINVFLEQKLPLYGRLPAFVGRMFDQPWLIRWAASRSANLNARSLGALTVSMLRGAQGNQRAEVEKLCRWLAQTVRPQAVVLSNMLIAGCAPQLKSELGVPVLATLQGDDVFLESLLEPFRAQALAEIRRLVGSIDGFLVHSRFYADFMGRYLGIPADRFHQVPLGVDTSGFPAALDAPRTADRPPSVGYLARLAPEKGLHQLVDAFLNLRNREGTRDARLQIAGWIGKDNQFYAEAQFERLRAAGLGDAFEYRGVVNRQQKIEFLRELDVLSVPTVYHEPKGLFVLEAMAAGVPVVQPAHGAFPELLEKLGGGRLVPPDKPECLADQLHELLCQPDLRNELGRLGHRTVHDQFHADAMAEATWSVIQRFLAD